MGYKWNSGGKSIQNTDDPFLFANCTGKNEITFGESHYYFNSHHLSEVELIEKITYEFKEIHKRNVVKVGGISYYEDELTEALKNIKPI